MAAKLLIVVFLIFVSGAAWAEERIELIERYKSLPADAKSLLNELFLSDLVQESLQYWPSVISAGVRGFSIALVDLNDDGVDEAFVSYNHDVFCGTSQDCPVSIYRRQGTGWRFAGSFHSVRPHFKLYVFVEDVRHSGWRVLNNGPAFLDEGWGDKFGGTRLCWSDTDPPHPEDRGYFGGAWQSGDGGYFEYVQIGQPCPKK